MKSISLLSLYAVIAVLFHSVNASVEVTARYGLGDSSLNGILEFENLYVERFEFQGEELAGASYVVSVSEYSMGERVSENVLFDGTESEIFKIENGSLNLAFFVKAEAGELKMQLRTDRFGSKKLRYKLSASADDYVLRDFFFKTSRLQIEPSGEHDLFSVITPTVFKDGSGSYCQVIESGFDPDEWWNRFKVPHYFVVSVHFQ